MKREELIDLLFEKAKEYKIDDMEAYITRESSMNLNIYEGELEKYIISEEENLSLRGVYQGKMGYSYTEKLSPETLDELINNLIQYAENNDNEEIEHMSSTSDGIKAFTEKENLLDECTVEDKIEYLLDLEKKAYDLDKRVKTINSCSYSESTKSIYIKNTKGLELEDSHTMGTINLSAVVEEGKDVQTGYSHHMINRLTDEYKDKLIQSSVGDALAMLGARPIASGNYQVILRNNVAADMFSSFSDVFLASKVQENLSLMKGKLDSKLAVESLNIIENPLMENGKYCRNFDDEGTATYSKHLIENGVLKTFLHNKKTANKDKIESTGNGFKTSHKGSIGVMPTNMYIAEGSKSLDEMMVSMDSGIIITDIHGLHAGINATSGDFSLSANGLLIEDGRVARPLAQITVAGNLYTMLNDILDIGRDTKFSHPSTNFFGSPSIHVKTLAISGK